MYRGDILLESTIDMKFTTRAFATAIPSTLDDYPEVVAYVNNSTTPITAGITLTVDFDGVVGLNNVRVAATAGNGFAAGDNVDIVITVGTVADTSVVGEVVASFSIQARSAATPAQVNAEVLDVLNVDTFAQPGQTTPAATTSIRLMLAWLYKAWRNRTTQTASQYSLFNDDAVTVDQKATFSDDGTTADRGEVATGP